MSARARVPIRSMTLEQALQGLRQLETLYRFNIANANGGRGAGFRKAGFMRSKAKYEARIAELKEAKAYLEELVACGLCGGDGVLLGTLGRRTHYRCRNCGMEFSHVSP